MLEMTLTQLPSDPLHLKSRTRLAARPAPTAVCMGASPLPTLESLRKAGLVTIAALMIGSSPLHAVETGTSAVVDVLTAEQSAAGQELSPAEMLVQKTTEMQVLFKVSVILTINACSMDIDCGPALRHNGRNSAVGSIGKP